MTSTIKERPILFSGPMVRAILEGRKTVTRRAMKPQPILNGSFWEYDGAGWSDRIPQITPVAGHSLAARCPYGQPGERLWVRETCLINDYRDNDVPEAERADTQVVYKADGLPDWEGEEAEIRWRPSIHMPRWCSRILLEISEVRIERLQSMSFGQALREGVRPFEDDVFGIDGTPYLGFDPRETFSALWDGLGGNWDANPWVWVVEFKRVMP